MKHALALGLCLTLLAFTLPAHASKVYRWVDDEGVTHFTAQPPRGRDAQEIRPRTGHSEPVTPNRTAPEDNRPAAPQTPRVETVEAPRDAERCAAARQELQTLQSAARIRVPDDNDGLRYLSDDERQQRAIDTQAVIDAACR